MSFVLFRAIFIYTHGRIKQIKKDLKKKDKIIAHIFLIGPTDTVLKRDYYTTVLFYICIRLHH